MGVIIITVVITATSDGAVDLQRDGKEHEPGKKKNEPEPTFCQEPNPKVKMCKNPNRPEPTP